MTTNASQRLAAAMSIACVALSLFLVHQWNRIDELRRTFASTAPQREERRLARMKKSLPSNQTVTKKDAKPRSTDREERRLKNENRAEASQLEKKVHDLMGFQSDEELNRIITMEQLKEENEQAYTSFKKSLEFSLEMLGKRHEQRLSLLQSLNPSFLSEDKFTLLQDALKKSIANNECDLAFKRRPLPENGHYDKYGNIWYSANPNREMQPPPNYHGIIEEYCANALGLKDVSAIQCINELDLALHFSGPTIVMPIFKE